jgi:glutamine amidotransferase
MCRLYGFHANEKTKVECSLVRAQNALLKQGIQDREGLTHGHGWGLGVYTDGKPRVEKRCWAAWDGEHFSEAASLIYSKTVISHVRRATVGPAALENTHPFSDGHWVFAHNGTIPHFAQAKPRLLAEIAPEHRDRIQGQTDSEHMFRYFLTLLGRSPDKRPRDVLKQCLSDIIDLCAEIDPGIMPALNTIVTDGHLMFGSRLGRTLWYLERKGIVACEYCGLTHVRHDPQQEYRAIEIASEPITHEEWHHVPSASVFHFSPSLKQIEFEAFDNPRLAQWTKAASPVHV